MNTELTFADAVGFNHPLDDWDVRNVYSMYAMFGCYMSGAVCAFNQPLASWDVGLVEDFESMFENSRFNQDVSGWNMASAARIRLMFIGAKEFRQNLCPWGELLSNETWTGDAFVRTKCPIQDSPNLTVTPPGPFCFPCDDSMVLL